MEDVDQAHAITSYITRISYNNEFICSTCFKARYKVLVMSQNSYLYSCITVWVKTNK